MCVSPYSLRYIDAKVIEPSRPTFKTNRMFSVSLRRVYSKRQQKSLAQTLLKTTQHLTTNGQEYLAKGHLAPDADFVLKAEQDATYYYVNVAPQWQAVNNGNWKVCEHARAPLLPLYMIQLLYVTCLSVTYFYITINVHLSICRSKSLLSYVFV